MRDDVETQIDELWVSTVGWVPTGRHENLFAQGGDSLEAYNILDAVNERFQIELDVETAFADFTISNLAEMAERMLADLIESMSDEQAQELLRLED